MKLGHRPLIWKNGRVLSNTCKSIPLLDQASAVQRFLISSTEASSGPALYIFYKSQPAPKSARNFDAIFSSIPLPDSLVRVSASYVFIARLQVVNVL